MNFLSTIIVASGNGLVQSLLLVLLVGLCVLLIWWVGTWFISKLGAPVIVRTVWDGFLILIGLFIVINFVMGLAGHPLVALN